MSSWVAMVLFYLTLQITCAPPLKLTEIHGTYYRCQGEAISLTPTRDPSPEPLHVAYVGETEQDLEEHWNWIQQGLLDHLERPVAVQSVPVRDLRAWTRPNSLVITGAPLNWYFDWLVSHRMQHWNVSVIHLGDTDCSQDCRFYQHSPMVWRNYYCPEVFHTHPNAYYLPLGWLTPPDPLTMLQPAAMKRRAYDMAFIGLTSPDRVVIQNLLGTFGILENYPVMFQLHPKTHDQKAFFWTDSAQYNGILAYARLALVPGNSTKAPGNETARLYESLSAGAIPVAFEGNFLVDGLFGGNRSAVPFPVIKNWRRELLPLLEKAHHDVGWASMMQERAQRWWKLYLGNLRAVFRQSLESQLPVPSLRNSSSQNEPTDDPYYISPDLLTDSLSTWQHLLS